MEKEQQMKLMEEKELKDGNQEGQAEQRSTWGG